MKKLIFILMICILSLGLFAEDYNITSNKENKIGSLSKKGYEITIPKNTFSENLTLSVNDIDLEEGETTYDLGLNLSVKGKESEFIHFNRPVKIAVKVRDVNEPQKFFFWFFDHSGKQFMYLPELVNLKEKTVTYSVYHLGSWFCGKASSESAIDRLADYRAIESYDLHHNYDKIIMDSQSRFDVFLRSLDIVNKDSQALFATDFYSVLKLDGATNFLDHIDSAVKYNKNDQKKLESEVNSAIYWFLWRALYRNVMIDGVSSVHLGRLADAANYARDDSGYSVDLITSAIRKSDAFSGYKSVLIESVQKKQEKMTNILPYTLYEDLYALYSGNMTINNLDLQGNIDACAEYLGIGNTVPHEFIESYCSIYNISERSLTESAINRIGRDLKASIKENFSKRDEARSDLENQKEYELMFLKSLDNDGCLSSYAKKYFDDEKEYKVKARMWRLTNIRETILSMMSKGQIDSLSMDDIAELIEIYIQTNDGYGCNDKFYANFIDLGYAAASKGFERKGREEYAERNNSDRDRTGDLGVLVDIIDILSGNTRKGISSKKQNKMYNLVDIRENRGFNFNGSNGFYKFRKGDYKIDFEVRGIPSKIAPGESFSLSMSVDRDRIPKGLGVRTDFSIRLTGNDFRFTRNEFKAMNFDYDSDTVTGFAPNNTTRGNRVYLTITCDANGDECSTTYVYEYYQN